MKQFFMINLLIKNTKKDTCNKCDTFHMSISLTVGEEKETLQIALENHLEQADMIYFKSPR